MTSKALLPDLAQVLSPVLQSIPAAHQPLLIALAERQAAQRYRTWASSVDSAEHRTELLACADREDEIARRVESLYPEAEAIQKELLANNPTFAASGRSLFAPYSIEEQLKLQAQGERLGAATWRAFAKRAPDANASKTFLDCAALEEQSAEFLESITRPN
jgi:hypothetical protein